MTGGPRFEVLRKREKELIMMLKCLVIYGNIFFARMIVSNPGSYCVMRWMAPYVDALWDRLLI